jgi:voltage-gated potassium channel
LARPRRTGKRLSCASFVSGERAHNPIETYLVARRRMVVALVVLASIVALGAAGYWYIGWLHQPGYWRFGECLYMTAITISTVGYGEILDVATVAGGREWTLGLLVFGVSGDLYALSAITSFFVEADFADVRRYRRHERRMGEIHDHTIVCGIGKTGSHVVQELIAIGHAVVAIDENADVVEELSGRGTLAIQGDATEDAVLERAGLSRARALVATLDDDRTNMFVVVTARQSSPRLRIVAKAVTTSAVEKLRRAGADAVVSPTHIGGLRLVSELVRPTVVRFLDEMMRDKDARLRIEEATVRTGGALVGKSLSEANLREDAGVLVLGVRTTDGKVEHVPPATLRIEVGQTLIAMGRPEQIAALRKLAGE